MKNLLLVLFSTSYPCEEPLLFSSVEFLHLHLQEPPLSFLFTFTDHSRLFYPYHHNHKIYIIYSIIYCFSALYCAAILSTTNKSNSSTFGNLSLNIKSYNTFEFCSKSINKLHPLSLKDDLQLSTHFVVFEAVLY